MNFTELNNTSDEKKIIEFFQQQKLIHTNMMCTKKSFCTSMKISERFYKGKRIIQWRCSKCGSQKSIRKGTFIENSKLSILLVLKLVIHWALQTPYITIANMFGITRQTAADFCHRIRHVVSVDYDPDNIQIGGPGAIIEIDETLIAKVCIHV